MSHARFEGTTDAIGAQFFLKNIHPGMKNRALNLFGNPGAVQSRPNVFGELMRALVSPSRPIEEAVRWVLRGRKEVDVTLHARMMSSRYCDELRLGSFALSSKAFG